MPIAVAAQDVLSQCHCRSLRRAARLVTQVYDDALAPAGLRSTQFTLMAVLRLQDGLSIHELAAVLELDRTTMGKNLRPLQRLGYVSVEVSNEDSRARTLTLTQVGATVFKQAYALWSQVQRKFEDRHGVEAAASLRSSLISIF